MNSSRKGDISEHRAMVWLMEQGYEVFSNIGCTGPADLIAWHPERKETRYVDVKTLSWQKGPSGWYCIRRLESTVEEPVEILYVYGNSVGWEPELLPKVLALLTAQDASGPQSIEDRI